MGQDLAVSVIIDTYNYGRFIGQAIESALDQTLPSQQREIIVVDDGSTDDTCEQVGQFGAEIRYIRKDNGGQASAFNAGVAAAKGEIICFLDADDYFYAEKLACVLGEFSRDPSVGVVYNRYDIVDDDGTLLTPSMPPKLYRGNIEGRILLGYVCGSPSSGISVRRDIISRIRIPEEPFRISADYFLLNILPLVTSVGVLESSLHAYRRHSQNLYLGKSQDGQMRIHGDQRDTIWQYAAVVLDKRFRTGVHTMCWIGDAKPRGPHVADYMRESRDILTAQASLGLRLWTFSKLTGRFLLPPATFAQLQSRRNRS